MQYDLAVITDHNVWIWQYRSALFYRTRAPACKATRHNDLYVCAAPCTQNSDLPCFRRLLRKCLNIYFYNSEAKSPSQFYYFLKFPLIF